MSPGPLRMPPELPGATLLIVDDQPDILEAMGSYLEEEIQGLNVVTYTSPLEALDHLAEGEVNMIFTDFRMPEMDGLSFLARAREVHARVPQIIMTAYPDLDVAMEAINKERVERFFKKPLDPEQVAEAVREVLGAKEVETMRREAYAEALALVRARGHS